MSRRIIPAAERMIPVITLLPAPVRAKVEAIAARERVSLSEVTRRAVVEYVQAQEVRT